jgi:hypothetical protein
MKEYAVTMQITHTEKNNPKSRENSEKKLLQP